MISLFKDQPAKANINGYEFPCVVTIDEFSLYSPIIISKIELSNIGIKFWNEVFEYEAIYNSRNGGYE